jgi:K+-sensing histidine kinase KdpD
MSSEIILKLSQNEILTRHSRIIKSSSYRMEGMIQNILDFSRCQMGLGIELHKEVRAEGLEKILEQVVKEMKHTSPERVIKLDFFLAPPVTCDLVRIGQLLGNLLGYADAQAINETPIKIELFSRNEELVLVVSYKGTKISNSGLQQLFDPFHQKDEALKKGVGLGLYIASEIARAHEGAIEVVSTRRKTCFTFKMNCE